MDTLTTKTVQLYNQAVEHHRAGELSQAEVIYRQILELDPAHADALHLLGTLHFQSGDLQAAFELINRAIELSNNQASYHCNLGNVLKASGNADAAEASFRRAIALDPQLAIAHYNLACLLKESGKLTEAVDSYQKALRLSPNSARVHINLGETLEALGKIPEALSFFEKAVKVAPDDPDVHTRLGIALFSQGKDVPAQACFERVVVLTPDNIQARIALGIIFGNRGDLQRSIAQFREAVRIAPESGEVHLNLAATLVRAGILNEAVSSLRRAIELAPELPEAHYNLGVALGSMGQMEEALSAYQKTIVLNSNYAEAHANIASILWKKSQYQQSLEACDRALLINPELAEAHVTKGNILKDWGLVEEALKHYRKALSINPELAEASANLIFSQHYLSSCQVEEVHKDIVAWNQRHSKALIPKNVHFSNPPISERRISIGYVSANLRTHPGGFFLGAVIANHDREKFKICCYVDIEKEDEHSRRIKANVDEWQLIPGLTDEALANRIRADGIDILVDMNRFTGGGHLLAFARKPAPIQVTWMGGPIMTTGLETIDYVLSDRIHTPPEYEQFFVEKVVRLNNAYAIYQAPPYAPPVSSLPALNQGIITFGCFNYIAKIQRLAIDLWAEILKEVPNSQILLQSKAFGQDEPRQHIHTLFADRGVDPSRILLCGSVRHNELLEKYNQVDIAFDPFPYSGGITTCEALWMGVPVIAMPGNVVTVRHTISHLHNAGLDELIADTPSNYKALAVELASDLPRLADLRATLRDRISHSPLCDGAAFTRQLEEAYQKMWQSWCEEQKGILSKSSTS
jgi:protein O-GlcNAc transferase